jgi:hypothetical protein
MGAECQKANFRNAQCDKFALEGLATPLKPCAYKPSSLNRRSIVVCISFDGRLQLVHISFINA